MHDFLKQIVGEVRELIRDGYYDSHNRKGTAEKASFKKGIEKARGHAVIAEVKRSSPSKGQLTRSLNINQYVRSTEKAGVIGFSILTQPRYFDGSLENLREARQQTTLPLLMKDFIISAAQIDAAEAAKADAVLLIQSIFNSGLSLDGEEELISRAHSYGLEVLTEVHNVEELEQAANSQSDMIGINNRSLQTLKIDLTVSQQLLHHPALSRKVVVAESGVLGPEDARLFFQHGADAILVGSYLVQAANPETAARLLVKANE